MPVSSTRMFQHASIRTCFGFAILWQLWGLVNINSHFRGIAERDLAQQDEQQQQHPEKIGKNPEILIHPTNETSMSANKTANKTSLVQQECFGSNSETWIRASKFSNSDHGITPELLDVLMEGPLHLSKVPSLFDQTICHPTSPLRSFPPTTVHSTIEATEDWYHRFLHLSLHYRFHRPALKEHRQRKQCVEAVGADALESFRTKHEIGTMDFECKDAKFVVIPVASIGFGAFLNTQASLSILLALKTNRIPVFSSRSFFPWQIQKGTNDPWLLAPKHCSRSDLQCYFLPTTPCALTVHELETAPIYGTTRREQRILGKNLTIPEEFSEERVVVVNPGLDQKTSDSLELRTIAGSLANELLDEWRRDAPESSDEWEAMESAQRWILDKANADPVGLLRQVYVYLLRPNPHYQELLQKQLAAIVPPSLDPSQTIGLAVRGSDKCLGESMCLPFDRYMEMTTEIARPLLPSTTTTRPNLILTTEDPNIFRDSLPYQQNTSFPFRFLVNDKDNLQGSGYPKAFAPGEEENTIVSSLVALGFHFHAGKVYLNCCSNFHLVLNYLLQAQCGASRHGHAFVDKSATTTTEAVSQCLNEEGVVPTRYRICCGWAKKRGTCADIWKDYLQEKERKNLLAETDFGGVQITKQRMVYNTTSSNGKL